MKTAFSASFDHARAQKTKGQETVDVRFTYDINGILEVGSHCPLKQKHQKAFCSSEDSNTMDKHEIEKLRCRKRLCINSSIQRIKRQQTSSPGDRLFTQTSRRTQKAVEFELFPVFPRSGKPENALNIKGPGALFLFS